MHKVEFAYTKLKNHKMLQSSYKMHLNNLNKSLTAKVSNAMIILKVFKDSCTNNEYLQNEKLKNIIEKNSSKINSDLYKVLVKLTDREWQ